MKYYTTMVGKDLQDHLVQPSTYHQYFPLNHVISTTSKHFLNTSKDGNSTNLPGQPVPVPDQSIRELFPNIHPESPLAQLEAIPSSPITSYVREETDLHLATVSLQVVTKSYKVTPDPPD